LAALREKRFVRSSNLKVTPRIYSLTSTMASESSRIHFKSLSGDILSLPFHLDISIESYRQQIAQHLSHTITPERIIILPQNPDQSDDITPPSLQSEEIYSYFVRDDHQVHYTVSVYQELNAYHDFHSDSPVPLYKYHLKVFQLVSSTPHTMNKIIVQEFSFYYNPETQLFYHQHDVRVDTYPSPNIEHVTLPQDGIPLYTLAYQHLDIPWFNKDIVSKLIVFEWEDIESPYLYHSPQEQQHPSIDEWRIINEWIQQGRILHLQQ
jgi:hypothetical protein